MTTTGARLVQLSGLGSATAIQHLVAIPVDLVPESGLVFGGSALVSVQLERMQVFEPEHDVQTLSIFGRTLVEDNEAEDEVYVLRTPPQATVITSIPSLIVRQSKDSLTVQLTDAPSIHVLQQTQ